MISSLNPIFIAASLPVFVQGLALAWDEFVLHRKRGLSRWERWGHPLDTATVLAVNLFAVFFFTTQENIFVFLGLCIFSCLFVTKDEWVHARECCSFEHWLHSLLFILHPINFVSTAFFWLARDMPLSSVMKPIDTVIAGRVLIFQSAVLFVFMLYQLIYWNFIRAKASDSGAKSSPQGTQSTSVDPQSAF